MGCKKESDYRDSYTGKFHFTTLHSTITMCYHDTTVSDGCVNGWKVLCTDTVHYWSNVVKEGIERIKIQFGDGIIGVFTTVNFGDGTIKHDTIKQTIYPILLANGEFVLPEYPPGGHNRFEGSYLGKDTINIIIQVGGLIGGYDKYEIVGVRMMGDR